MDAQKIDKDIILKWLAQFRSEEIRDEEKQSAKAQKIASLIPKDQIEAVLEILRGMYCRDSADPREMEIPGAHRVAQMLGARRSAIIHQEQREQDSKGVEF